MKHTDPLKLPSREPNDEVCDATKVDSSTKAGNKNK
jgi:hypothetical protein